ncbi:MAG TPA: glycosyltransferase family 4 protein [Verrucomicrobiota bacterium]|nr:glycosyltransferase family 4 protein [Verrucomicrobiota bacterium]
MKILIYCTPPFSLAHGGQQTQIEQTMAALRSIGLEVEPLRWWDDKQTGDIIHYAGRMPADQIELAHKKRIKIVMAQLLSATGARSRRALWMQRTMSRTIERFAPGQFINAFNWKAYRLADACVALTSWEAYLMRYLFDAPPERVHVVPNGVEEVFLQSKPSARGPWIVCTATITAIKRVLELAEAAVLAKTPVWIIGRAYSDADPYAQRFFALAKQHPDIVRYEGPVNDRAVLAGIYSSARGFALLSTYESLSLSALEAASCGCPLFLSDLPWARCTFGEEASYCPVSGAQQTAAALKTFHDCAPSLKPPKRPLSWGEVAAKLREVYARVLSDSR